MKGDRALAESKENTRRILKPMMEKKRRQRINVQLDHLKELLCKGKDKLEKADILELTVAHLKTAMQQPRSQTSGDEGYKAGYNQCAKEFSDYISSCSDLPAEVRAHMLRHLGRVYGGAMPEPVRAVVAGAGTATHLATAVIIVPATSATAQPPPPAPVAMAGHVRIAPAPPALAAAAVAPEASMPIEHKMWRPW